jgi:hypothetical protein
MKKLTIILSIVAAICTTSCGNNENKAPASDTSGHEPATAIPDNSNATNPSVPDTAFKDSVPH